VGFAAQVGYLGGHFDTALYLLGEPGEPSLDRPYGCAVCLDVSTADIVLIIIIIIIVIYCNSLSNAMRSIGRNSK